MVLTGSSNKYRIQEDEPVTEEPAADAACDPLPHGNGPGPEVGTLTANNLARHMAYLRRNDVNEKGASAPFLKLEPPRQSDASENRAVPEVRTLAAADPDISNRRAAYLQRKESRREARKLRSGLGPTSPNGMSISTVDSKGFLSNVPEVEADVPYRFNFVLVGTIAARVAELVCESLAARRLSSRPSLAEPESPRSPTPLAAKTPRAYRCLCAVTGPLAGRPGNDRQKLAKLGFAPVNFGQDMPKCMSRLEALSTAMVFVLLVDSPSGGQPNSLQQQLQELAAAIARSRSQTRSKLRPVRAVILCSAGDAGAQPEAGFQGEDSWSSALADFEQVHGDMWKFGPVPLQDGDLLHAAFAEIVSVRISQGGQCSEGAAGAPPGTQEQEPEEEEEGGEGLERVLLEQQMQAHDVGCSSSSRQRSCSRGPSECSEGWQRPPVFEAEFDGSECSEEALERHAKTFGISRSDLAAQEPLSPPTPTHQEEESPLQQAAGTGAGAQEEDANHTGTQTCVVT